MCNRFAQADVPGNCTITDIKTEWAHNPDRSREWVYALQATPLNKLFHKEATQHVERSSLRAEWQAQLENELSQTRMLGIFAELDKMHTLVTTLTMGSLTKDHQ